MSGLVYLTVQQSLRQSANDPQIQISEDIAKTLENGKPVLDFNVPEKTDISKSLAPYLIIYDKENKPVAGTGVIDNKLPEMPEGLLQYARIHGEHSVTWQPRKDIRGAIVIVPYKNGFVVVGKSLREVEIREKRTFKMSIIAGLITIITTLVIAILFDRKKNHN